MSRCPRVSGRAWRRDLALRVTDQVVHQQTGLTPLSVSADRIGHATMRCAAPLAELARRGRPVDRAAGSGPHQPSVWWRAVSGRRAGAGDAR
ncbi:hypothetical protein [Nonomuraea sp. NPDC049784]|uniref:hypothetical protein n=1 Tax=Nonomuraea sp. NPDC049784 TaxID=3154361 RepID=UPI0033F34AB9